MSVEFQGKQIQYNFMEYLAKFINVLCVETEESQKWFNVANSFYARVIK